MGDLFLLLQALFSGLHSQVLGNSVNRGAQVAKLDLCLDATPWSGSGPAHYGHQEQPQSLGPKLNWLLECAQSRRVWGLPLILCKSPSPAGPSHIQVCLRGSVVGFRQGSSPVDQSLGRGVGALGITVARIHTGHLNEQGTLLPSSPRAVQRRGRFLAPFTREGQ